MEKKFKNLIDTLQDSIFTWSYFSDFKKVKSFSVTALLFGVIIIVAIMILAFTFGLLF